MVLSPCFFSSWDFSQLYSRDYFSCASVPYSHSTCSIYRALVIAIYCHQYSWFCSLALVGPLGFCYLESEASYLRHLS